MPHIIRVENCNLKSAYMHFVLLPTGPRCRFQDCFLRFLLSSLFSVSIGIFSRFLKIPRVSGIIMTSVGGKICGRKCICLIASKLRRNLKKGSQ
jgi:hypothetical protein